MKQHPKVVVIGSANIDLIMRAERVPHRGELLPDGKFSTACGANQAVALARLGASVAFIGGIGQDHFGEILLENLAHEGVSISHVVRDPEYHTGTVSIVVDAGGENTMVADFGSNLQLCPHDIERAADALRKADLMLLQGEVPESASRCALSLANETKIPIIMNPAPMSFSNLDLMKGTYLITPNLVEAEALAGLAGKKLFVDTDPFKKAEEAAQSLIDAGIARIIVTIGRKGSVYVAPDINKSFGTFPATQVDAHRSRRLLYGSHRVWN